MKFLNYIRPTLKKTLTAAEDNQYVPRMFMQSILLIMLHNQDQRKYISAFETNLLLHSGSPDRKKKSIRCLKKQQRLCDRNTGACVAFDERWTDWHVYLSWIIESSWNIYGRKAEPCLLRIMWLLRLDTGQWSRTEMETLMNGKSLC